MFMYYFVGLDMIDIKKFLVVYIGICKIFLFYLLMIMSFNMKIYNRCK